jgi:hypothetical protein
MFRIYPYPLHTYTHPITPLTTYDFALHSPISSFYITLSTFSLETGRDRERKKLAIVKATKQVGKNKYETYFLFSADPPFLFLNNNIREEVIVMQVILNLIWSM